LDFKATLRINVEVSVVSIGAKADWSQTKTKVGSLNDELSQRHRAAARILRIRIEKAD
jgi:hypothetical protein